MNEEVPEKINARVTALCVDLPSFDFINSEILSSVMSTNAMTSLDGLLSSGDNGNDEEIRIGKPRPERVLIFPDRQTSGSPAVNLRH